MNIDKSVLCCDDVFRRVSRFCLSRTTTTTNNNYSMYEEEEEEEEEKMGDEKSKNNKKKNWKKRVHKILKRKGVDKIFAFCGHTLASQRKLTFFFSPPPPLHHHHHHRRHHRSDDERDERARSEKRLRVKETKPPERASTHTSPPRDDDVYRERTFSVHNAKAN